MQNIKLTIYGDFWDSQIYSRHLYVFGASGELYKIDWDNLINNHFYNYPDLQTVAHVSFLESDLFYTNSSQILFKDQFISEHLKKKFMELSRSNIELNLDYRTKSFYKKNNNPLPFPHADSEIYYSQIYVALNEGIFSKSCDITSGNANKLWDAPVYGITASKSYTSLAISAGVDGLFEMRANSKNSSLKDPLLISDKHCSSCNWSDYNISATSHISNYPKVIVYFSPKPASIANTSSFMSL